MDDWRAFADARSGKRFCAHFHRVQERRSTAGAIARVVAGLILCAAGVLFWFLPGPGWLLIMFGVALFAGESERLASALDQFEVWGRDRVRRLQAWWSSAERSR